MKTHEYKTQKDKNHSAAPVASKKQPGEDAAFQLADNRPEALTRRKQQEELNDSPRVNQLKAIKKRVDNSPRARQLKAVKAMADKNPKADLLQGKFEAMRQKVKSEERSGNSLRDTSTPVQKGENQASKNNTGLPDHLKTGIENLSGYAMDDVKVHYNSGKPAQLNAHAYAQGNDIHLAAGQEKQLPHEAWHVVQQKQGRVKPTKQLKEKVNINDDKGLEKEADVMGAKAFSNGQEFISQESIQTIQQNGKAVQRSPQASGKPVLQRQEGELIQDYKSLKKGTRVKFIQPSGTGFQIEVIETKRKYWIIGSMKEYYKADSSEETVSDPIVEDSTETTVKEKPKPVKEKSTDKEVGSMVGKVGILDKTPSPKDVVKDPSESGSPVKAKRKKKLKSSSKESSKSGILPPVKSGDKVTMKVTPKPTLAEPVAGKKVFKSEGGDALHVEVDNKGEKEEIDLKAGQNYLNDELSARYYANESEIKPGKVTYGKLFGGDAVLGDGHHRFLWLAHYGKSIKAQIKKIAGGQAWNEMKYQPNPKKEKKPYLEEATTPALDIESENLDTNEVAKKLRAKWEGIDWGGLKKPGLVLSTKVGELTTTAQYNPANHTIKLNKDEKDPVKLWDNVLFEAQNALNAKVFDKLGKEKGGESGTTFQEYGKKMATAEYDSVKKYVMVLRELIEEGLAESSLTTLAQNNLAKWKKWDEESVEESTRIERFNNTPHSAEESKKDTKAALSSAELYAYEAVESSSIKTINSKTQLIIKDIFSNSAGNGYYLRDQFKKLKEIVQKGPIPWPEDSGPTKVVKYSAWLEEVKRTLESIKDVVNMTGTGVSGKTLKNFKAQFKAKIESAELTEKSVNIAKKLV